jgi:hypothetical protein
MPTPLQVNKWNQNVSIVCETCNVSDSIMHILYECQELKNIWEQISKCINMKINLQDIIVGRSMHYWNKEPVYVIEDTIISHISYYLYTFKMKCKNGKGILNQKNLNMYIISKLIELCKVYRIINPMVYKIANKIVKQMS